MSGHGRGKLLVPRAWVQRGLRKPEGALPPAAWRSAVSAAACSRSRTLLLPPSKEAAQSRKERHFGAISQPVFKP